jgi:hypothetical protein
MTVRWFATTAIACIVVTSSAGGPSGTAVAQTGTQGAPAASLRVTPISVPEGTLRVYLPDDIAAGDTITGTVVAEPAGNTDEQRTRNAAVLEGYVVDIGPAKGSKADTYGRVFMAAGIPSQMYMIPRNSKGAEVRRINVPIQPQQPAFPRLPVPNDYHFPQVVAGGQPFSIHGPFSGDLQQTNLAVGGQPVQKLAQSPRTFIAAPSPNVSGPTNYQLNERGVAVTAPCNVITLKLSAPQPSLKRGEHTTIHISITGLEGIRAPVPLRLENATPGVVALAGGQSQVLTIAPSDVGSGRAYGADREVTGVSTGSFSISATIDEQNRAMVDGASPTPQGGTTSVPEIYKHPGTNRPPLGRIRRIEQLDVGRPGEVPYVPASEWGRLRMTYVGSPHVLYLNLTVNHKWVLQNVRVLSEHGANQEQEVAVAFGLGNKRGVRVVQADYGMTLWAIPSTSAPPTTGTTAVTPETLEDLCTGGGPTPHLPVPKGPIVGGQSDKKDEKHTNNTGFPNQEAPKMGCVPTGFSNSLQWLKKNNDSMSGVNDDDLSIDSIGKAVGFKEGKGTPNGFIQKKMKYVEKKKIPVDTFGTDAAGVGKWMDEKCDVEIWTAGDNGGHFAAVVGISKGQNGKYSIDVAHDTKQGEDGGTTTETVTYDPRTNKISGGTWMDGTQLQTFVIECPKKKKKK